MELAKCKQKLELAEEKAILQAFSVKKAKADNTMTLEYRKQHDKMLSYAIRKNRFGLKSIDFPIVGAFVIFESVRSRNACLHAMNNYSFCSF